jgi:hypothetical protein
MLVCINKDPKIFQDTSLGEGHTTENGSQIWHTACTAWCAACAAATFEALDNCQLEDHVLN